MFRAVPPSGRLAAGIAGAFTPLFMLAPAGALAAPTCAVSPGLWDRPRSGAAILALEPLRLDVRRVP